MNNKKIVLASASPRRREILTLGGVPFEVCPASDEQAPSDLVPSELVRALARSKATQVAIQYANRVVLGADTMVVLDGKALGKPTSHEHAVDMLMQLQGREHQVMTGVWCVRTNSDRTIVKEDGFTDIATVKFFSMTRQEAEEYVATNEPMDKAGAYAIQGYGMRFVESICGDFYTVMGLPGGRLLRYLREF
jgi:septum formation protein